ncbi:MAG: DUF4124 domain-containing protein [Alcanivorax sp.]|nr:DUF4124 domain-containing protein [Alcanivorax sp.]
MKGIALTVLMLTGVIASVSDAQVYRWQDADGNTHFGARPPAGVESEDVGVASGSRGPDEALALRPDMLYGSWQGNRAGNTVRISFNRAGYIMESMALERQRQVRTYVGRWSLDHRLLMVDLLSREEGADRMPVLAGMVIESYRLGVLALRFDDGEIGYFRKYVNSPVISFPPEYRN